MLRPVVTKAAKADIRSILKNSKKKWGSRTATHYVHQINTRIFDLGIMPAQGHRYKDTPYLALRSGSHLIMYLIIRERVYVTRVIYGGSDIASHL